jgi:hypothetical protein
LLTPLQGGLTLRAVAMLILIGCAEYPAVKIMGRKTLYDKSGAVTAGKIQDHFAHCRHCRWLNCWQKPADFNTEREIRATLIWQN